MNKATKGAIAATAAAVLLIGGAGTLAFWSDSETLDGGDVSTGELALGTPDCDEEWVYAPGNAAAGTEVELIVPGDAIAKECTFTIAASGDNLSATLTTPGTVDVSAAPDAPSLEATVAATYASDGGTIGGPITEENDGDVITATIVVTFPFGTAEGATEPININDTQNITATLDGITVTLVQTET